jgi:hypothetical protein
MPLSQSINPHKLISGKKYLIEIQWNITNDLRIPASSQIIGTFIDHVYVRGRTRSFDSGLQLLLSRSRYESIFEINGMHRKVSSANKFYEILSPDAYEFASVYSIYTLPLPNDIKKEISYFVGNRRKLYYRKRRIKPKGN